VTGTSHGDEALEQGIGRLLRACVISSGRGVAGVGVCPVAVGRRGPTSYVDVADLMRGR